MTTAVRSPVTMYAEAVTSGKVITGRLVRLACERHLRDLKRSDIRFDEDEAQHAIEFFELLSHSKGEWAGQPLILEPWQAFIEGSIFGWKRLDGSRRFREVYEEEARKNGKSTRLAGRGLKLAFFDDEPGAEVYAAATKRDQAKIVFGDAKAMVLASPALKARIEVLVANLNQEATRCKFMPLGADSDTTDGLNIHAAIVDELHAHKTREMVDVLETATGARRQPLISYITTAGNDKRTVCWEKHEYAVKVLEGIVEDDNLFVYIATIDEGDDFRDPSVWIKANPNLGVSVKLDDLERKCEKAKQVPGEVNPFLQKHMDVWVTQTSRWLTDELWNENEAEPEPEGDCFVGLVVSNAYDLAGFVLWFPQNGSVLPFLWAPEDRIPPRSRQDMVPYDVWEREGFLTASEGGTTHYALIRAKLNELRGLYNIRLVALMRYHALQIEQQLMDDGFEVRQIVAGMKDMSPGTKELEKRLTEHTVRHGGHPVLRWAASNVAVRTDAEGLIRPDKEASTENIAVIEMLIMAIGSALAEPEEGEVGVFFV